ncbi:MAG TPA: HIG1 domain-containing protein [Burkholderiales bacterium]
MGLLVVLAAVGVAVALFNGILSMAYGGEADQRESHRHMFKRVGWQALAIALVLIALVASRLVEHGITPPG